MIGNNVHHFTRTQENRKCPIDRFASESIALEKASRAASWTKPEKAHSIKPSTTIRKPSAVSPYSTGEAGTGMLGWKNGITFGACALFRSQIPCSHGRITKKCTIPTGTGNFDAPAKRTAKPEILNRESILLTNLPASTPGKIKACYHVTGCRNFCRCLVSGFPANLPLIAVGHVTERCRPVDPPDPTTRPVCFNLAPIKFLHASSTWPLPVDRPTARLSR